MRLPIQLPLSATKRLRPASTSSGDIFSGIRVLRRARIRDASREAAEQDQLAIAENYVENTSASQPVPMVITATASDLGRQTESGPLPSRRGATFCLHGLDVEVHLELVWVRAKSDRIDLVLPLVGDPGLDEVWSEHVALSEVVVICLKCIEHACE